MSRISHSIEQRDRSATTWQDTDSEPGAAERIVEPSLTREQIRSTMTRRLTQEEQLLLILWYAERMEPEEIAEVLGSTAARIRIIHDHAIAQLREPAAA